MPLIALEQRNKRAVIVVRQSTQPRLIVARPAPYASVKTVGLPGRPGNPGDPGLDGNDARQVEFQASATHLQWHRVGDAEWVDLLPLTAIAGAPGEPGAPGQPGDPGTPGVGVPVGGSAGQVLTKGSAADFDTAWETPVAGGGGVVGGSSLFTVRSPRAMVPGMATQLTLSTVTLAANRIYLLPFRVDEPTHVERIGARVAATTFTAGTITMGIYSSVPDGALSEGPGELLFGGSRATPLTNTVYTYPGTQSSEASLTLQPGVTYWAALNATHAYSMTGIAAGAQLPVMGYSTTSAIVMAYMDRADASLPASLAGQAMDTLASGSRIMFYLFRVFP